MFDEPMIYDYPEPEERDYVSIDTYEELERDLEELQSEYDLLENDFGLLLEWCYKCKDIEEVRRRMKERGEGFEYYGK